MILASHNGVDAPNENWLQSLKQVALLKNKFPDRYLRPNWPAPQNIMAFSTTRVVGHSSKPFDRFNLAKHVQDMECEVEKNRKKLRDDLDMPNEPFWLEQLHTTNIVGLDQTQNFQTVHQADASYSSHTTQICAVMTADCLPILLTDKGGHWVAAIHAGWRGLANGIIQQTIQKYPNVSGELLAWLGPAISQKHFEVGSEVKDKFTITHYNNENFFARQKNGKYHCDLYGIARSILSGFSIAVYGGDRCTFAEKEFFYSYRRDGVTGRMASLIWINERTCK